jgi:hypothetical protein
MAPGDKRCLSPLSRCQSANSSAAGAGWGAVTAATIPGSYLTGPRQATAVCVLENLSAQTICLPTLMNAGRIAVVSRSKRKFNRPLRISLLSAGQICVNPLLNRCYRNHMVTNWILVTHRRFSSERCQGCHLPRATPGPASNQN